MNGWILYLSFGLGGGVGAVARHALTAFVTHRFPISTLVVNIVGCLILGAALRVLENASGFTADEARQLVFGFCGGLTTFSSFAYQSLDLHRQYTIIHAATNIVASILLCVFAFWVGHAAAGLTVG